ncbi:MAG: histidine kinase [Tannerella sp.]|nr:histidine kinase [Tannerella sp.]
MNSDSLTYDAAVRMIDDKNISFADKFELIGSFETSPVDLVLDDIYFKLLPEAKQQKDKTALMFIYNQIAFVYLNFFEFDESKLYLDSAFFYIQQVKDIRTLGAYYYYMGYYYAYTGNVPESHYYFYKAISCYEQLDNREKIIVIILYGLSYEYIIRNDIESLRTIINKMEQIAGKKQDNYVEYFLCYTKSSYYTILYETEKDKIYLDSIIHYTEKQINLAEKNTNIPPDRSLNKAYMNMVEAELSKSDSVDADNLERLYSYIKKCDSLSWYSDEDKQLSAQLQQTKAFFFYKSKQYVRAEQEALQGLVYTSESDEIAESKKSYSNLYNILALTYEAKQDYRKALEYEKLKNQTETEINKMRQYEIVQSLEKQYELDKKEQAIQELNNKYLIQKKIQWLYVIVTILSLVILLLSIRWMRNRRKILTNQLEINRLKAEETERQIDVLKHRTVRAKFIPHFTGNVLNSINYLISKNPNSAREYIAKFSDFSTQTLRNSDELWRSIQEELNYSELYLELEKLRFEEKLEYAVSIAPGTNLRKKIPAMILQTFCENAIKHGLRPKPEGGRITIRVYSEANYSVLTVEDTGIGREKARLLRTEGTKEGLNIVRQQLEIFNRNQTKPAYFQIIDLFNPAGEPSGTRFELYIP